MCDTTYCFVTWNHEWETAQTTAWYVRNDSIHVCGTTHCFVTIHHEWMAAATSAVNVRHDSIQTCGTTHCFVTWHSERVAAGTSALVLLWRDVYEWAVATKKKMCYMYQFTSVTGLIISWRDIANEGQTKPVHLFFCDVTLCMSSCNKIYDRCFASWLIGMWVRDSLWICQFVTHCDVRALLIVNVLRMSSCNHIYDRCLRRD